MDLETLILIKSNFTKEIEGALNGEKNSLPFIIHKISPNPIVKNGEIFQVFVVGGTVGKIATLKKNGNTIKILSKKEEHLPFRTEEEFLEFINIRLPENVNILVLNLAYPIKPIFAKGKLDGILLAVTKEGGFHGLVGKQIGKEIENYVLAKRKKRIKVAVANDTVCLLTSGLSQSRKDELACGIVGTGFNMAFFLDKNKLVNLESASFDKFSRSEEGKIIDKESTHPGKAYFEKEVAGAYLYKHFNIEVKEKNIKYPSISSTEELNIVSHKNISEVSEIAQNLLKRSAQLVACQIAGIAAFKNRDMVCNMEGSLFWKGNNYKETVEQTVKQLAPEYNVDFVEIRDSAIIGAAKLVS